MDQQSSENSESESENDEGYEESNGSNELKKEKKSVVQEEPDGDSVDHADENDDLNIRKFYVPPFPAPVQAPVTAKTRSKHPTTQIMVDMAITALNERVGSSVPAIKKYILQNYANVYEKKLGFLVLKYIKKSVEEGKLKQNKKKYKLVANKKIEKKDKKTKKTTTKKKTETKAANDDDKPSTSKNAKLTLTADAVKKKSEKTTVKKKEKTAANEKITTKKTVAASKGESSSKKELSSTKESSSKKVSSTKKETSSKTEPSKTKETTKKPTKKPVTLKIDSTRQSLKGGHSLTKNKSKAKRASLNGEMVAETKKSAEKKAPKVPKTDVNSKASKKKKN